jgi:GMP synthase-like glutamine amidotransferase
MNSCTIVDNGTGHIRALENLFQHLGYGTQVVRFDELGILKIPGSTLLILSGSNRRPVLHESCYDAEKELVANHHGPIIGICLGMELIAHIYGEHLHLRRRLLHRIVKITDNDGEKYKVYMSHRFGVQKTDSKFDVLARARGDLAIIKHKTLPIIGFQFHPEVHKPNNDGADLLAKYLKDTK